MCNNKIIRNSKSVSGGLRHSLDRHGHRQKPILCKHSKIIINKYIFVKTGVIFFLPSLIRVSAHMVIVQWFVWWEHNQQNHSILSIRRDNFLAPKRWSSKWQPELLLSTDVQPPRMENVMFYFYVLLSRREILRFSNTRM